MSTSPPDVLIWNGRDLPEELRALPPGVYRVSAIEHAPVRLSPEEEEGVRRGMKAAREGRVVSLEEASVRMEAAIKRGAARGGNGA